MPQENNGINIVEVIEQEGLEGLNKIIESLAPDSFDTLALCDAYCVHNLRLVDSDAEKVDVLIKLIIAQYKVSIVTLMYEMQRNFANRVRRVDQN